MKGPGPKTAAGFSDLKLPAAEAPENGHRALDETVAHLELGEHDAREHTVARLRLLWENRRLLRRVSALGFVLSTVVAFLIPNSYQSTARLMPPDDLSKSGLAVAAAAALSGGAGALGGMANELLGVKSSSDLLVGVLLSRTVEDKLIEKFSLRELYGTRRMEDARRDLASLTDISVDRKSQIITLKVTDRSPQRAAAIAQAYVEELNHTLAEVSTSSARRERIFLEGRLRAVSQDLETAEKGFSQFASKNTAIDIKEQGKAMVEAAATLQGELIAARSELAGLREIYTDDNIRVRSAKARVAELDSQLKKVGGESDSASSLKPDQGDSLYPSIRRLPLLGVDYADLYRKTKVQEAIFETLTQEYEIARLQEAKEIPTVKVLDPPNIPERKSFPPHLLLMALGTALAFSCGVSWVFGRRKWEASDPSDPAKILAIEVLSTLRAAIPGASRNGDGQPVATSRIADMETRATSEKDQ